MSIPQLHKSAHLDEGALIRKPVSVLADPGSWFLDSGFCGGPD